MIRIRTLLTLVLLLLLGRAAGITVYISGTITDLQGSNTGPGHQVYVKTDFSSPFHYYKTVYTNDNGHYSDTVENVPDYPVLFQISTYDCNNVAYLITSLSSNSPIIANFQICTPAYSGCRAAFRYDSISGLNYHFTDQSVSNSTVISWKWNFGDLASGTNNYAYIKDPIHVYSASGIYNVKLVITSQGGCSDSLVKTVFIRIPEDKLIIWGHITNEKNGDPIPSQPVMINNTLIQYSNVVYSDNTGYYADTIPAIPDGIPISIASYDCTNVLHSNTVYSSSIPQEVDFVLCWNDQCKAAFAAVLDSNNKSQNTFLFKDLSYGNPDKWTWSFGDGSSSHETNPTHKYLAQGSYTIVFTITKEDSTGAWTCFDSTSRAIRTSSYFNLGGLLFTGLFPINNPHNEGDTGVAYLYRAHNNWIVPIDTTRFTNLGYYTFLHVLEGTYIVKAGLTKGSSHYKKYLPAYNGDQVRWQMTSSFLLNEDVFDKTIHLYATKDSSLGPAILMGSVIHKDDNVKLPNAEVMLMDDNLVPIKAIYSDSYGNFEFPSLPYGTYNLYPEVTGKFARILQVTVDSLHPLQQNLQLEVYDLDITGISPIPNYKNIRIGKIYPNPVTNEFQFRVQSSNRASVQVEILSVTGNIMFTEIFKSIADGSLITVALRNAAPGMYFLVIRSEDGSIINTQKIIKN